MIPEFWDDSGMIPEFWDELGIIPKNKIKLELLTFNPKNIPENWESSQNTGITPKTS